MSGWGGRKVTRMRTLVIHTYGRTCWLCNLPIMGTVSVDHVIPRSKGGTDDIRNLRPAHPLCNYKRGNSTVLVPLSTTTRW